MSRFNKKWILLIIPLFLLKPILNLIGNANQFFWGSLKNAIYFLESNPLVTVLCLVIILLLIIRRN